MYLLSFCLHAFSSNFQFKKERFMFELSKHLIHFYFWKRQKIVGRNYWCSFHASFSCETQHSMPETTWFIFIHWKKEFYIQYSLCIGCTSLHVNQNDCCNQRNWRKSRYGEWNVDKQKIQVLEMQLFDIIDKIITFMRFFQLYLQVFSPNVWFFDVFFFQCFSFRLGESDHVLVWKLFY